MIFQKNSLSILVVTFITFSFSLSNAYDGKVHEIINKKAAEQTQILRDVLEKQLGLQPDPDKPDILDKLIGTRSIKDWISYGGKAEDFGKWRGGDEWYNVVSTRGYNHFHDPLKDWDEAGFDKPGLNENYRQWYGRYPISSILWGLDIGSQDFEENMPKTGDWSWGMAREYYYIYLTGKDFWGDVVAGTDYERKTNFADCFRSLGQVMHLLQDASVPLHTRNDFHTPVSSNIETYTLKNKNSLNYSAHPPDPVLLSNPQPDPAYGDIVPISGLFDRNQYNEEDPIPLNNNVIGLAEYSNANFITEDTMWTYQHPKLSDTNSASIDWLNYESIVAEDDNTDNRIYIRKTQGEQIEHFAAIDYWTLEYYDHVDVIYSPFLLDKECWKDYAQKLIPRAVGYSAGLLDYFFRGRLYVALLVPSVEQASLNILSQHDTGRDIDEIAVLIQNDSKLNDVIEPIGEGTITLTVSYKDLNSGSIIYKSAGTLSFDSIPEVGSGSYFTDLFHLEEPILTQTAEDITYYLAFKGNLGNEEAAVIGKVLKGPLLYNVVPDEGLESTEVTITGNNLSLSPYDVIFTHDPTKPYIIDVINQTETEITAKVPNTVGIDKPGYTGLRVRHVLDTEEMIFSNPVPFFPIAEGIVTNTGEELINVTVEAIGPIYGDYDQLPEAIVIEGLHSGTSGQIQLITGFTYIATANTSDTKEIVYITPDAVDFIFEVE